MQHLMDIRHITVIEVHLYIYFLNYLKMLFFFCYRFVQACLSLLTAAIFVLFHIRLIIFHCVFCCSDDQVTVRGKEWSYIASQGPLSSTCQDFWQMVWEQGVAIIAMVTAEEVKIRPSEICLMYTVALFASSNRLVLSRPAGRGS